MGSLSANPLHPENNIYYVNWLVIPDVQKDSLVT